MKIRIISVLLGAVGILLCLQSASGGRAANNEMDRTNSPGSSGTCGIYCHNNSGTHPNTQLNVVIKDVNNNVINAYIPGEVYNLEFEVTSDGNPFGYGLQAVILDSLDMNAGDLLTVSTTETQLTTISNGREFVEHQGINSTGMFRATWMAPPAGTGAVTIYGIGIAVDGSGTTQGDDFDAAVPVILSENITSSTQHLESNSNLYEIFPNPSQGAFYIRTSEMQGNCSIKVFNLTGQIVYQETVELLQNIAHSINLKEKMAGVYWVEIESESTKKSYPMRVY